MSPWTSDQVGPLGLEQRLQAGQRPYGDLGQRLPGRDDVEVVVGHDAEDLVDLVEHLPVLPGHHDQRPNAG